MPYFEYKGELDMEGKACGHGVAVHSKDPTIRYVGTWLDDEYHGIGVLFHNANHREEAEFKYNSI